LSILTTVPLFLLFLCFSGVVSEKANKGRTGAQQNMRSIGKNVNPASIKFSGKMPADL